MMFWAAVALPPTMLPDDEMYTPSCVRDRLDRAVAVVEADEVALDDVAGAVGVLVLVGGGETMRGSCR